MTHQILLFFCVLPLAVAQLVNLRFSQVLDTKGSVLLRWDFNTSLEEITFELQVKTTGWVGFGLSPGGGMAGADIVIGGINPSMNPTTYFSDYHGVGEVMPVRDPIQNYVLLSSSENGTFTTLRFRRKFTTCDPLDVPITADTMHIIAAYGTTDTIDYHGSNRFQKTLQLLTDTPISAASPPNPSYTYDLKMTNFPVPSTSTTYGCAYLPLPSVTAKNHIYKFEANIQSGNEDLVHHILVYSCPNSTYINVSPGDCYASNSPFYACFQVLVGWAVGGGPFTLPSNAGISLGTSMDPLYIRLEIHYNNSGMQSGRKDSSGIRIYYTPVVREHDVGVLTTGLQTELQTTWAYFIPPHAEAFKVYSVCNTSLFNQVNGQVVPDMQVFASILHTHLTGRAVQVVQYRNEAQIGFLGRDMSYDFNLQETRYLPNIMPIKMGDRLQVECTYDTTTRTSVTYSGLSTTDEMCLGFLFYYPRNNIAQCLSNPDYTPLAIAYNTSDPSTVSWTQQNIQLLQKWTKEQAVQISLVSSLNGSSSTTYAYVLNITDPPVAPCATSVPVGPSAKPTTSVPVTPSAMPATTKNGAKPQSTSATKAVLTVLSLIALFIRN